MEQTNEYKHAVSVLSQLEQQQETHTEEYLAKAHTDLTTEIEDIFTQCFVALALRKESLLREVGRKLQARKTQLKENQIQCADAIDACKEIIRAGAELYKTNTRAAAHIWKTASVISNPVLEEETKIRKIPVALLQAIEQTIVETNLRQRSISVDSNLSAASPQILEGELPSKKARISPREDCTPSPLGNSFPFQAGGFSSPFLAGGISSPFQAILQAPTSQKSEQLIPNPTPMVDKPIVHNHPKTNGTEVSDPATLVATSGVAVELPRGLLIHPVDKHIYFCDSGDFTVKKISPTGEVSVFAAKNGSELKRPFGIAYDNNSGSFFVTNLGSHVVSKISPTGEISIFAGNRTQGSKDGFGMLASFHGPHGIAVDQRSGCVYVSDCDGHRIRRITPQGHVTTFAGSGKEGYADAFGKSAQFNKPWGLYYDEAEQALLVCDAVNNKLRRISANSQVTTMCSVDAPSCVTKADNGTIVVSSFMASTISKIVPLGNGKYEAVALVGKVKGAGGKECKISAPYGLAYDGQNNSFIVSEFFNPHIRKVEFPV